MSTPPLFTSFCWQVYTTWLWGQLHNLRQHEYKGLIIILSEPMVTNCCLRADEVRAPPRLPTHSLIRGFYFYVTHLLDHLSPLHHRGRVVVLPGQSKRHLYGKPVLRECPLQPPFILSKKKNMGGLSAQEERAKRKRVQKTQWDITKKKKGDHINSRTRFSAWHYTVMMVIQPYCILSCEGIN